MAENWKKTALIVIGMQKDFAIPGAPFLIDGAPAILPNVMKAVEVARERGILVVWAQREHDALGRDVEFFKRHLYRSEKGGSAIKGSEGAELVEGFEIREGDYKLVKTRMSAFFNTHLHSVLLASNIDSLVIVGIQTPNCIRQTVYDAVALDYPSVSVIVDATAAKTPEIHAANISDIKNIGVATPTISRMVQGKWIIRWATMELEEICRSYNNVALCNTPLYLAL